MNSSIGPDKKANSWLVSQLDGYAVETVQGEHIGTLIDVLPSKGNDIWVVKSIKYPSKEILIPALKSIIEEVDEVSKKIKVNLPPGLKEIYES